MLTPKIEGVGVGVGVALHRLIGLFFLKSKLKNRINPINRSIL